MTPFTGLIFDGFYAGFDVFNQLEVDIFSKKLVLEHRVLVKLFR